MKPNYLIERKLATDQLALSTDGRLNQDNTEVTTKLSEQFKYKYLDLMCFGNDIIIVIDRFPLDI